MASTGDYYFHDYHGLLTKFQHLEQESPFLAVLPLDFSAGDFLGTTSFYTPAQEEAIRNLDDVGVYGISHAYDTNVASAGYRMSSSNHGGGINIGSHRPSWTGSFLPWWATWLTDSPTWYTSLILKIGSVSGLIYFAGRLAALLFKCRDFHRPGGPGRHMFTDSSLIRWTVEKEVTQQVGPEVQRQIRDHRGALLARSTTSMDTSGAPSTATEAAAKLVFQMAALRGK
jgi:hypothetical protein